ncbi:hypothetical protein, partial [Salmonella enterica]|uniref:hypothetical protein n=1 Tax=Salmonella enterica TaxID=28901 RepID=UPI00398C45A4
MELAVGPSAVVTTVYDRTMANCGLERGLNAENCAASYDETKAYTLAWAEQIRGVPPAQLIRVARAFGDNAGKPHRRSLMLLCPRAHPVYTPENNIRG